MSDPPHVRTHHPHPWNVSSHQAVRIQVQLRRYLRRTPPPGLPRLVGGVDVGFPRGRGVARAAAVVLALPGLALVDQAVAEVKLTFPYVPGLLSFREAPAILEALGRLATFPEALICDGHGYAHPRRFGLACHLGVLLDLPTVGCAKSILVGTHAPLGEAVGSTAELIDRDEVVGVALRTRQGVKPVYISAGHRVDLAYAVRLTLASSRVYRLPEPCRLAHQRASAPQG